MSGLTIRRATRSKAHLKIVIDGVSGAGKTYSALLMASGIGPNPRVLLIDTENGSGELYSDLFPYDYIRLAPPYKPSQLIEAIDAAVAHGVDVIIIDSLSHFWKYILAYKDTIDSSNPRASFGNWQKAKALFEEVKNALLQVPAHVIATLRAASEWTEGVDSRGNKSYQKTGTKPIAEPDLEFEFTVALRIERSHQAYATKDRTGLFDAAAPFTPSAATGAALFRWLSEGAGELSTEWKGAALSQEARIAQVEAERIGVGSEEASTEDLIDAAERIKRERAVKAGERMRSLGLNDDKDGRNRFGEVAEAAGLDRVEAFYDLMTENPSLTTWVAFETALRKKVKGFEENPSPDEPEEPQTASSPEEPATPEASEPPAAPTVDVEAVAKLSKALEAHASRDALKERIVALGYEVEDIVAETVSRYSRPTVSQIGRLVEELEEEREGPEAEVEKDDENGG